jgi:hypothetical protein
MNIWLWMIFTLFVQVLCPMLNPKGHQRGKILTMPLRKRVKFFDSEWCRTKQIFVLIVINIPVSLFVHFSTYIYFFIIIALFLDDYFTNDDDMKKWWMEVRNKIKWKMELPQPATESKVQS